MSSNVQTLLSKYNFIPVTKEKLKHTSDDARNQNSSLDKSMDTKSPPKDTKPSPKDENKAENKAEDSPSGNLDNEKLYIKDKEEKVVSNSESNSAANNKVSDGKSPIFEKKIPVKKTEESKLEDEYSNSDGEESDWDSDEHQDWSKRSKLNGFPRKKRKKKTTKKTVKRKYRRPVSDDNSEDDEDTKGHYTTVTKAVSEKDKVKVAELNTLVLLYPHKTRDELEEVLNSSKNLDDAINSMIVADPAKMKRKRKDSDDSGEKNKKKPTNVSLPVESVSSDSESQGPNVQTIEERIDFLSDAFTAFSREELRDLLRENKWCLEKTIVWLASGEKSDKDDKKQDSGGESADSVSEDDSEDAELDFENSEEETAEQTEQNIIQSFFDDATLEELMGIPGCSKKKAEIIISLRPFKTYDNLWEKLDSTKALTSRLIGGGKEVIHMREVVMRLMKRCEKISKEMGKGSYLINTTDLDEDNKSGFEMKITKQPLILNPSMALKPYQLVGVNWLRILHSQEVNGILADEMGLGKTVQAIAFLAYLLEQGEIGPHVIIVPSSTIDNWMNEIQRWCPTFNILMYYGSQEERQASRHQLKYEDHNINIVLTTYNMATGCIEDRVLFKKTPFQYAIFDEGHMLKNMSSLRYQNLMKIQAERRLLLTGTPLQNNLLELISLLCFVMPDMFIGKTEQLKKSFTVITKSQDDKRTNYEMERIAHAKKIMRPFVLRRLKSQVLKQMPKKQEEVVYCQMIPDQQEQYESLINRFTLVVENQENSKENTRQCMLMQLRKSANHPLLQRRHFNDSILRTMSKDISREPSHRDRNAQPSIIFEDMEVMSDFELHKLCILYKKYLGKYALNSSLISDSGKFRKFDELLPDFKENGDRVLIFSQFTMILDIIEEYLKIKEDIKYLRLDGQTPVHERQRLINQFNSDPGVFIFLLSTRAGGLGINLTSANVVIIHDIDFNPYNDKQAEDRCHRMGQTKTVKVIRFLSNGTVEEAMFRCAQKKLSLEKDITSTTENDDGEQSEGDVESLMKEVLSNTAKKTD